MSTHVRSNTFGSHGIRLQEVGCRKALEQAAAHLERAAQLLASPVPDYADVFASTVSSIRQSYTALLAWHGLRPSEDATLDELAAPAERLASILRTCRDRAWPLEALEAGLRKDAGVSISVREGVVTSYYTARNTLLGVLTALPDWIGQSARAGVQRAQTIRVAQAARLARPPEVTDRSSLRRKLVAAPPAAVQSIA